MPYQVATLTTLFHQALVDPTRVTTEDFNVLLSKYPYSQPLHFAFARKKVSEGGTDSISSMAILAARNPIWLQEYIHKPIPFASEAADDYVSFEETVAETQGEEQTMPSEHTATHEDVAYSHEEEMIDEAKGDSVEEDEAEPLDTLVHEAIGAGDYFALHTDEPAQGEEELPVADNTIEKEEENVSLYNDELMPYSFRWWLHKTRLEHADTYQPFASPVLPTADKASFDPGKLDEVVLDQQIRENIFRLQHPEEKLSEEVKKKEVQYTRADKNTDLIERFIREDPQIQPPMPDQLTMENKARKSSEEQFDLVTETLANIYVEQAMYVKAIEVYKKLILKFPEKKSYFAAQIKNLEEKLY